MNNEILIDIKTSNNSITIPLKTLSHTIVFGATGSGKSNFLHMLVTSLVKNYSSNEIKLSLIDPKYVEFNMYKSLPHLLFPLVRTSSEIKSLLKVCAENTKLQHSTPLIVIIDELAELTYDEDIVSNLVYLLNKGSKSNIYLIMATQRPDLIPPQIISKTKTQICFPIDSDKLPTTLAKESKSKQIKSHGEMIFVNGKTKAHIQTAYITQSIINDAVNNFKTH